MGYTHYWSQRINVTPANWIEMAEGCERLFEIVNADGAVIGNFEGEGGAALVDGKEIAFNGIGDESHESFCLSRKRDPDGYLFCKTARKDYDTACAAILIYMDSILPETYTTDSDGSLWNYRDALELARRAWPQKANQLDFPRSLKQRSRFESYPDSSDRYAVCIGLDGVTYIEDRKTQDLRRLPEKMQGPGYSVWQRAVPHNMRASGSYYGDYDDCQNRRLKAVWKLSDGGQVPPVVYDPLVHGLRKPELTSAQTY